MERSMKETHGYIIILIAGIIWGTAGIFGKLAFQYNISPQTFIALRFLFSSVALLVPIALFRRKLLIINKKDVVSLLILGIFASVFQRLAAYYALQLTTVTMAVLLIYTYPVFVTLYAALFRNEKVTSSTVVAIILNSLGVILVVKAYKLSFLSHNLLGIACGLLASLLFVLYFFMAKHLRNTYTNWTLVLYVEGIGAVALSPLVVSSLSEIVSYPLQLWALIFLNACFSGLLPYLLFTYALKYVESSKASILSLAEPLSAAMLSSLILKERLEFLQVIGIAMSIVSLVFLFHKQKE